MVTCAVTTCKNTSAKISKNKHGITFHRFPRDPERRRQWELAVNRHQDWTATASSSVCSEHFEPDNFYQTDSGLRKLMLSAIPAINISPCQYQEPTICDQDPIEINATDDQVTIELKHKIRRLEVLAANRKKRLNLMWQSKRRLGIKLERMKTLVKHLIKTRKEEVVER